MVPEISEQADISLLE